MASSNHSPYQPPWRIGIDIGGTFTDLVLIDAAGRSCITKAPSNPSDPADGVIGVVELAAEKMGLDLDAVLRRCSLFVHGSTIATNTLLERKGAKVGLLVTEGFRDSLEIRRGYRSDPWDHRTPWPEVLVPRSLRLPVRERTDKEGLVEGPLDADSVAAAVDAFKERGVTAVAICLLHSYRNPENEIACERHVRSLWPEVWVTRSSRISPVVGEFERSSTAVVDAYVAPRVVPYLEQLQLRLKELGLPDGVMMVQSNGGVTSIEQIAARPSTLLLSGPAAGTASLRTFGEMLGADNLISVEVGGTSCDLTVMADGQIGMTDHIAIDGYHATIPTVEIHTVGAGGGTIGKVDAGGFLQAGPEGAGAVPGPACYGKGGQEPTTTDAQLVLGRLQPGSFAGGLIMLDRGLARDSIEDRLASKLGASVEDAAAGMLRLLDQKMQHAIEQVSLERGLDPTGFTLVAGGGAGAMHAVEIARTLGCTSVYVPKLAGVYCAFGMCNTDFRYDLIKTWQAEFDAVAAEEYERIASALKAEAIALFELESHSVETVRFSYSLSLQYVGQQWTLSVAVDGFDPIDIRARFEKEHEHLYGQYQPGGRIAVTEICIAAVQPLERAPLRKEAAVPRTPSPGSRRPVFIAQTESFLDVPVFAEADLSPGCTIEGPAIIEESTTTVVVGLHDRVTVDPFGNYRIEVALGRENDG